MHSREDYLKRADMMAWSRFLGSPEGKAGLQFLRLACPRNTFEKTDNALVKNAIGHEFWHQCLDAVISLGQLPQKQERIENDAPLEQ